MGGFNRGLEPAFVEQLRSESRKTGGWWSDSLADKDLVIGVRENYVNVYWRGQSLFRAKPAGARIEVTTHEKYLLNPALAEQVPLLSDGRFGVHELLEKGFLQKYEGGVTLQSMKKAAGAYAGSEKRGCHDIVVSNNHVIDVEIAFPGRLSWGQETEVASPRVDLTTVEPLGSDGAALVFWEAKTFANAAALRARDGEPAVCIQIKGYRRYVIENQADIVASYRRVMENLLEFRDMDWKRELSPIIEDVVSGRRTLCLHDEPLKLIIFGYDDAQRQDARWKGHLDRLTSSLGAENVKTRGQATGFTLRL